MEKKRNYKSNFSKLAWVIRIITMSMALSAVTYYLYKHHQGKNFVNSGAQNVDELPSAQIEKEGSVIKMKIPVKRVEE